MLSIQPFPICKSDLHAEERALIQRILASSIFERSARLRNFLMYICDRSLSGHPEEVHEQFIGHRVFNRPINYNPTDDNIVRVSARQLRSKLREYFETEGREEQFVVEIPKGGYLPVFRGREPHLVPMGKPRSDVLTGPGLPFRAWTVVAVLLIVVLLVLNFWRLSRIGVASAAPSHPADFVTGLFPASHGNVQIVVCDSALRLMEGLVGKQFSLASYGDHSYLNFPKELLGRPGMRQFWEILASRQLSNSGDQEVARRLYISMSEYKSKVRVMNARNMSARDFMSGNFILLGSAYSNPWAALFSKGLNFQVDLNGLRDLHPSPGEKAVYTPGSGPGGINISYARIALVPNLTNTGRVLLVAGITMPATEAAADFLLKSSSTQKLQSLLGIHKTVLAPNFELLLETTAVNGTPKSVNIIAHRIYENFVKGPE